MARAAPNSHPAYLEPMAAESASALPEGPEWLYELKLDGYRALLLKDGPTVQIRSRNNKNLSRTYPGIVSSVSRLSAKQLTIDGEIVALDAQGRPRLQALQRQGRDPGHTIVFYAFDLLHSNGRDLTGRTLEQRRIELARVFEPGATLRLSQELPGSAADVSHAIRTAGLEGVMAKRRASTYQPGTRSNDWIKFKIQAAQEFVVGGFRGNGSDGVDALVVGYYSGKELRFAAKVRAGMVPHVRRTVFRKLMPLSVKVCPFDNLPDAKRSRWGGGVTAEEMKAIQWIAPSIVVQIQFHEWTDDGRLRSSSFVGVRDDKAARDVRREL